MRLLILRLETFGSKGGYGLDFLTNLRFFEEMSKADRLFTFSLRNTQNIAAKLSFLDDGFQDYVYGLRNTHGFGRQLLAAKITGYIDGTAEMMNERVKASMAHQSSLCEVSSPSGKVQ
jgi:hypothetical protein